jgi:hypothetical protein
MTPITEQQFIEFMLAGGTLDDLRTQFFKAAWKYFNGNKVHIGRALDVHPRTVRRVQEIERLVVNHEKNQDQ